MNPTTEPGRDNDDDGANPHHGRDAFGMTLNYHIGDFIKANSPFHFNVQPTGMTIQGLYNGNIAGWMWNSRNDAGNAQTRLGSVYRYDQLNRLRVDSVHTTTTSTWTPGSKWMSLYTYDADGNLENLYRADDGSSGLDNLKYHYYTSHPNRLQRVEEQLAGATSYVGDLENQTDPSNYAYDPTGNLTQDVSENIRSGGIVWTPYNKIDRIKKVSDAGVQIMKLAYLYDAAGNRVVKDHYATDTTTHTTRTYYVRDAQGNVMGIFKRTMSGYDIERQETPIYGSTRLGVAYKGALHTTGVVDTLAHHNAIYTRALRQRGYELTDHLGNVRATVSDMLIPRGGGVFDADLRTLTDYYPFGMQMPERTYEAAGIAGHRYGFNGKENDDDVKGEGNQQDYGFRIYDPRVARFLSVDPLTRDYPSWSPYPFAMNRPIDGVDLDGKEFENFMSTFTNPGSLTVKLPNFQTAQAQHYSVTVSHPRKSFATLKSDFINISGYMLSNAKANFNAPVDAYGNAAKGLMPGTYVHIDINGMQNDSWVKVISMDTKKDDYLSFTFVTLEGHVEAGMITFRLYDMGNDEIKFTINSISEVDYAMVSDSFARSEQAASWKDVLRRFVEHSGGKQVGDSNAGTVTTPSMKAENGQTRNHVPEASDLPVESEPITGE